LYRFPALGTNAVVAGAGAGAGAGASALLMSVITWYR